MDCRVNVLILGHSFVRRYHLFLAKERDNRTSRDMNVAKAKISYLGIGGRTVSKLLSLDIPKINTIQPKIVIFEMGQTISEIGGVALNLLVRTSNISCPFYMIIVAFNL